MAICRDLQLTHRIHEGEEAQTRPIALQLRELRPRYDIHEPARDLSGQSAGSHELLFESREASLERISESGRVHNPAGFVHAAVASTITALFGSEPDISAVIGGEGRPLSTE